MMEYILHIDHRLRFCECQEKTESEKEQMQIAIEKNSERDLLLRDSPRKKEAVLESCRVAKTVVSKGVNEIVCQYNWNRAWWLKPTIIA